MKVIEFDNFFCVLKEENTAQQGNLPNKQEPKTQENRGEAKPCACQGCGDSQKDVTEKTASKTEAMQFALPDAFLKSAQISGDMELEIMKNALVLTSQQMTVMELLGAIESLEEKLHGYYQCLIENFIEDVDDAGCDCEFCEICMNTNGSFPDFMKAMAETRPPEVGMPQDLGNVSEEMVEKLHDLGLCLSELNYAIMEDEIIYYGSPKS